MVEDADAVGSAALTRATSTSTATSTVTAASTSTATATRAPMVALATSPDSLPQAPPGTILVMGPDGGYAVPPRRFTLLFGRDREDVHVPVGVTDPYVSRRQGVFTCSGQDGGWWLSNTGNLPIEMPGGVLLLRGHRRLIEPGYTSLFIHTPRGHHFLEVRVVGHLDEPHREAATPTEPERDPDTYELTPSERLVLTALAERYLQGQDQYPLPRTWEETARLVNGSHRTTKTWTFKSVAYVVESVRVRLHDRGVRGLMRDEVGEPVGTSLSANLIRELLRTATLTPDDLELLDQTM